MEELLYADEESLENCKTLELVVCTVKHGVMQIKDIAVQSEAQNTESETSKLHHPCKEKGQSMGGEGTMADVCNIFANIILQENSLILDIDMDYFSTQNPFKLLYTEVSEGMICSKFIIVVPYTGVLADFHVAILTRKVRYLRLKDVYIHLHEAYRQQRR